MKLTMGEVFAIRKALAEGATLASQAEKYEVSVSNIAAIKSYRSWKDIGLQFKDQISGHRKRGRKRKFSQEKEDLIREEYSRGEITQQELADREKASLYTIHNIIHRE